MLQKCEKYRKIVSNYYVGFKTHASPGSAGVCNSPRGFLELVNEFCSTLRFVPRPRPPNSFDIFEYNIQFLAKYFKEKADQIQF